MKDILNLPGWNVIEVEEVDRQYIIHAEYEIDISCCPACSFMLLDRHGRLKRKYSDTPIHGQRVTIVAHRKRYKCTNCGKTFAQDLPGTIEKHRMTGRLSKYIQKQSIERTFISLAEEIGVDEKTIRNVFHEHIHELDAKHQVVLPECLGIDELKLDKRFRCVLSDIESREMIDLLRNRDKNTLANYLYKFPDRSNVKLVCMDMWHPYKAIVRELFPNAKIVVDKFHFVRMAGDAVNKIRKEISAELTPVQRRQMMHDRFLLLRRRKDLEDKDKFILDAWLGNFPTLATAYAIKEELYAIWDLTDRKEAEARFEAWRDAITDDIRPGFAIMLVAAENWHEEIFNYFDNRVTNAYTECLNGLMKLTNRIGRGYSFDVIRAKMLYCKEPKENRGTKISVISRLIEKGVLLQMAGRIFRNPQKPKTD